MFDNIPEKFDPAAYPPALRYFSYVVALVTIGALVFELAASVVRAI